MVVLPGARLNITEGGSLILIQGWGGTLAPNEARRVTRETIAWNGRSIGHSSSPLTRSTKGREQLINDNRL